MARVDEHKVSQKKEKKRKKKYRKERTARISNLALMGELSLLKLLKKAECCLLMTKLLTPHKLQRSCYLTIFALSTVSGHINKAIYSLLLRSNGLRAVR